MTLDGEQLKSILEEETQLHWSLIDDNPDYIRLTSVSYEVVVEYIDNAYRFNFDDAASTRGDSKLGPVKHNVKSEFRDFVQNAKRVHIN